VGQVFRAEAAREFAASKQTSDHSARGNKSRCDIAFQFTFHFFRKSQRADARGSRDGNRTF